MISVKYHEAAEDELLNEIGYLERQAERLGHRFFAEVQRAESLIAQFPEAAEEIQPGIRKRLLTKFRYSLIYSIEKGAARARSTKGDRKTADFLRSWG